MDTLSGTPLERDRKFSEAASPPALAGLSATAVDYLQLEETANAAALLWLTGYSERACVMMEGLLAHAGNEPTLLNNLAMSHLFTGRVGRACDLLTRAATLVPADRLIAGNLAKIRKNGAASFVLHRDDYDHSI